MSTPAPSQRLGPYELIASIGKGGMGEVWRALDPRVNRSVAIKISAERFNDRFEREAHAIASLNHSNICTLFDVGPNYLVMELIEGPTLADRIQEGPIPFEEALRIARAIADALDAAHEKNIVHRDLKPSNIKVSPDGTVKVLDFGLAKTGPPEGAVSPDSPTLLHSPTMVGVILGTAAYMSPEQARGKTVDKRTDIWAFGVVLFEMLTGKRPFEGEDLTETLASVVKSDPNLTVLPHKARRLVAKCLDKDPKQRLRDIGDWAELLVDDVPPAEPRRTRRLWIGIAAALAFVAAAAVLATLNFRNSVPEVPPAHLALSLPPNVTTVDFFALSRDGRKLALKVEYKEGPVLGGLAVRRLDSDQLLALPNTVGARGSVWSPDGNNIAFWDEDDRVKLVSATGGPAQQLCEKPAGFLGVDWNSTNVILAGEGANETQLMKIDAATRVCAPLPRKYATTPMQPHFLPDGSHFLFRGREYAPNAGASDITGVYLGSLENSTGKRLLPDDTGAIYAPAARGPGFLVFIRDGALVAQSFDPASASLRGDVFKIAENASLDLDSGLLASAAPGVLVYGTGKNFNTQLTWVDRAGKVISSLGPAQSYGGISLSPDGRQVVVSKDFGATAKSSLWLRDTARDSETRITSPGSTGAAGVWSPDGNTVIFSGRDFNLVRQDIAGGGREEIILKDSSANFPSDWSRDGKYLLFTQSPKGKKGQIWVLPDPAGKPEPPWVYEQKDAEVSQAQFSPDGRWVAYVSMESGSPEVFVRPFPSGPGRWKISDGPAGEPRWRRDGKEIYYVSTGKLPNTRLVAVPVKPASAGSFAIGTPQLLFAESLSSWVTLLNLWTYVPSPDGQRFLVLVKPDVPETIHVLTNWTRIFEGKKSTTP